MFRKLTIEKLSVKITIAFKREVRGCLKITKKDHWVHKMVKKGLPDAAHGQIGLESALLVKQRIKIIKEAFNQK